jgi:hypothetical protein
VRKGGLEHPITDSAGIRSPTAIHSNPILAKTTSASPNAK